MGWFAGVLPVVIFLDNGYAECLLGRCIILD